MNANTIASLAKGFVERRVPERERMRLPAKITFGGRTFVIDCTIRDLSKNGARVAVSNPDDLPEQIVLIEPKRFMAFDATIAWRRSQLVGLSFDATHSLEGQLGSSLQVLRMYARNARKEWSF